MLVEASRQDRHEIDANTDQNLDAKTAAFDGLVRDCTPRC